MILTHHLALLPLLHMIMDEDDDNDMRVLIYTLVHKSCRCHHQMTLIFPTTKFHFRHVFSV